MHEAQVKENELTAPVKVIKRPYQYFVVGTRVADGKSFHLTCADKATLGKALNDPDLQGGKLTVIRGYELTLKFKGYSVN